MPLFFNVTSVLVRATKSNGLTIGFPPRVDVFVDDESMSGSITELVTLNILRYRGHPIKVVPVVMSDTTPAVTSNVAELVKTIIKSTEPDTSKSKIESSLPKRRQVMAVSSIGKHDNLYTDSRDASDLDIKVDKIDDTKDGDE